MSNAGRVTFQGTYTAIVTPFRNGLVDWDAFASLIEKQLAAGVEGIVACGTTGESPTLTHEEWAQSVRETVKLVGGKCCVVAGTGGNDTAGAIRKTQEAADLGADAALIVTPYYNKPTQDGLFAHYSAIAEAVDLPIVLYNVPSRCGVDIRNDTVVRLCGEHANIVAHKDASLDATRTADLIARSNVTVLSGDDSMTLPMISLGAKGVISVIANLVPAWMKELVDAGLAGRFDQARAVHLRACALADELGQLGPNPLPVKSAMAELGWLQEEFRLPMCPLATDARARVGQILSRFELS